jgi:hypothetical protein
LLLYCKGRLLLEKYPSCYTRVEIGRLVERSVQATR